MLSRVRTPGLPGFAPRQLLACQLLACLLLCTSPDAVRTQTRSAAVHENEPLIDTLIVGGDYQYPPMEYLGDGGAPEGFHIEIMRRLADVMGFEVRFRLMHWDAAREALEKGEIDVLPMLKAPGRTRRLQFSSPLHVQYFEMYVRKGERGFSAIEDLEGRRVLAQRAALFEEVVRERGLRLTLEYMDSEPDALRQLAAGRGECAVVTQYGGRQAIRRYNLSMLEVSGPPLLPGEYCFAVTRDRRDLVVRLNQGLALLRASGEYDRIRKRWLDELDEQERSVFDIVRVAAWIVGPLTVILLVTLVWSWSLRRAVARKTQEVQLELAERLRAEDARRESDARFRRLADNAPDIIYRMSLPDGRYEYISQAVELVTGYPVRDFYERPRMIRDILHPDALAYFDEAWESLLAGANTESYEYPIIRRDGEIRWLNQRNVVIRGRDGATVAIEGIVTDVTERKRAEERSARLNEELEVRVRRRTAQLEDANRELEAFAYSVSHDLRAPLRAIDGFARIIEEDHAPALPPDALRYFAMLRENVVKMGRLIDDLLTFSRTSRTEMLLRPVDPRELIDSCLDDLRDEMIGRRIDLRIADDLPVCDADGALLRQVWFNLLSNALKFTRPRDPAVIEICVERHQHATVYCIRDNGTGFDMRHAHKLFGVFQRLHRADEYEGTGVGLAIVQRIIRRHGGDVRADAALEQGATFRFTVGEPLPVADAVGSPSVGHHSPLPI